MKPLIEEEGLPRGARLAQLEEPYEDYWITPDGLLWSDLRQRWLKGYVGTNGYKYYTTRDRKRHYAHRLVAFYYLGLDPNNKMQQVNHRNFDRLDNYYLNLEVVSPRENNLHAHTNPNRKVVSSFHHPNSKLTKEQAIEIFLSQEPQTTTAKNYGVSARTVHDIRKGAKYSWATKEVNRTCAL